MEVKVIGQMDNTIDHTFESANRVYDKNGLAPTVNTCGGGGLQPKIIVAMRGRYEDGHKSGTTHQRLEPNLEGVTNTLTSVQKDNLVMEKMCISTKGKENEVASTILAGYERTNMTGFNADNGVMETKEEVINPLKGLTENGWHFEQNIYDTNGITRALKAGGGSGNIPKAITQYRIRKLTPKECWRLMDFTDEDFEKAAQANSNTQLYRQAGNSIPKNLLVAIFGQMLPGKENIYKEN